MKILISMLAALLTLSSVCYSAGKSDAGTKTAQFLEFGAGARASGMGEAFTAISDDESSVYWNPAGLVGINKRSLSVMHAMWVDDISYQWASYIHPTKIGNFGLGVQYLSYGDIPGSDESGLDTGNFSPNDLMASLSYGKKVYNIDMGITLKYISSKITNTATAFAGDIGLKYNFNNKLTSGMLIQNVGTTMKFIEEEDSLPMNVKVGVSYKLQPSLLLAADVTSPTDNELIYSAGCEKAIKLNSDLGISARAGYKTGTKDIDGLQGIAGGLGLNYKQYKVDYAFVPFGDLGNTQRISLSVSF